MMEAQWLSEHVVMMELPTWQDTFASTDSDQATGYSWDQTLMARQQVMSQGGASLSAVMEAQWLSEHRKMMEMARKQDTFASTDSHRQQRQQAASGLTKRHGLRAQEKHRGQAGPEEVFLIYRGQAG